MSERKYTGLCKHCGASTYRLEDGRLTHFENADGQRDTMRCKKRAHFWPTGVASKTWAELTEPIGQPTPTPVIVPASGAGAAWRCFLWADDPAPTVHRIIAWSVVAEWTEIPDEQIDRIGTPIIYAFGDVRAMHWEAQGADGIEQVVWTADGTPPERAEIEEAIGWERMQYWGQRIAAKAAATA